VLVSTRLIERPSLNKSIFRGLTTGGSNDNVRAVILENVAVRLDIDSTIKHGGLDVRKILGETLVLMSNLEGKFARVAQDQHRHLVLSLREGRGIDLMQSRKYEYSSLAHPGLGLANNIHSEYALRDAFVLDLGRMLETAIDDRTKALRFQDKIFESRSMNAHIVTPEAISIVFRATTKARISGNERRKVVPVKMKRESDRKDHENTEEETAKTRLKLLMPECTPSRDLDSNAEIQGNASPPVV